VQWGLEREQTQAQLEKGVVESAERQRRDRVGVLGEDSAASGEATAPYTERVGGEFEHGLTEPGLADRFLAKTNEPETHAQSAAP
jgi:hypothetical protein